MERLSQRECVLLGYSPQRSFENSMRKPDTNPEMDFSDVFGGAPRRFSIQESRVRYSFSEAVMDPEPEEDAAVLSVDEKPVFGAETVNRRVYPSDDFFDDIFKGDENKSFNSPRRRSSRDFFGSTPAGSRVMSPSRPLPPKSEPFSTSFPSQFSLPAKMTTKPTDSAQFGSTSNRGPHNKKGGGVPNGISNGHTSDTSLSRFFSQAKELQSETRNDQPWYRQSPLSKEVRNTHQESSGETNSDEKGTVIKSKKIETKEVPLNSGQFHFSIYKWAGSGVQSLMPLGGSGKSRFKDKFRTERCSSSNGRIENDFMDRHLPAVEEHVTSPGTDSVSLEVNDRNSGTREDKKMKSSSKFEEGIDILSKHETNEKETHVNQLQTPKTEPKPLHELLHDENQEQDNGSKGKENEVENKDAAKNDANVKKKDAKRIDSYLAEVTDASLQNHEPNSGAAFGKTRTKGKIREFVKIFNYESSEKIKNEMGSQSNRWKQMDIQGKENGFNNADKTDDIVHVLNKTKRPVSSSREDGNFNKNKVKEETQSKSSTHKTSGLSTNDKNASQFAESLPNNFGNKVELREDPLRGYFQVEELPDAVEKVPQNSGESEQIQASNAKIQQWSSGRNGNIRSLLSTLQFVLWPESGWKPVPLVDLIEASAVKRAHQRALLCLHPDKLQQKGAASHQKYIAEQVFDILQEAWDHFNSLGGI